MRHERIAITWQYGISKHNPLNLLPLSLLRPGKFTRRCTSQAVQEAAIAGQRDAAFYLWTCAMEEEWEYLEYAIWTEARKCMPAGTPIQGTSMYLHCLRYCLYLHGYSTGANAAREDLVITDQQDKCLKTFFRYLVAYLRLRMPQGRFLRATPVAAA